METLILICLLLIIVLLLHDKVKFSKELKQQDKPIDHRPLDNDIMGRPKGMARLHDPKNDPVPSLKVERYAKTNVVEEENLSPSDEAEDDSEVDYDEEEEEWRNTSYILNDQGFAEGVTFEELQSLHDFVNNDRAVSTQSGQLLETAKKLQGTELFSLMQSSVEGASKKIAQLLDSTFNTPNLSPDDQRNSFNINDYL